MLTVKYQMKQGTTDIILVSANILVLVDISVSADISVSVDISVLVDISVWLIRKIHYWFQYRPIIFFLLVAYR